MLALSLRQPWAYAVAHAGKRLENRKWRWLKTGYWHYGLDRIRDQRIAIHASKGTMNAGDAVAWSRLGFSKVAAEGGFVLAVCKIVDVIRCKTEPPEQIAGDTDWPIYAPHPGDVERLRERWPDGKAGVQIDKWWLGPYAFVLDEVVALQRRVPCTGALGFWDLDKHPDAAADVARQLAWSDERCPDCGAPRREHDEWDLRFCPPPVGSPYRGADA